MHLERHLFIRPLHVYFIQLLHILPLHQFVYIYSATWNISSSLLMPLIGRSLDFYFFKTDSSLRPHTNILVFYYYYYFVFSVMLEAFTWIRVLSQL